VNDGELTGHGNQPQPKASTAVWSSGAAAAPPQEQAPSFHPRALQADRV